ncbi:MAG: hypothetical protein ACOYM3_04115 [Terrimicrobiaceae bacterium]
MIPLFAAPMAYSASCDHMQSASDVGQEIRQALSGVSAHMRSSFTFGEPWHQTIFKLSELMRECSHSGWDGYDAPAISFLTASNALEFIRTIPLGVPLPEISATSAGDITFEWAQTPRQIVTVAIGENGEVHYAALNALRKTFGSYPMDSTFEPVLSDLIETVLG